MVEQFAAPPINPIVSIRPLTTPSPGRDAMAAPSPLSNLPPGTTIEGFVVNRDSANNPILRTSLGDIQMQSDVFVKTGSEMVIRVDATSETRARIITIDGLIPQDYATQNARGLTQDTIMTSQLLQRPTGVAPGALPQAPQPLPLQAMLLSPANASPPNPLFLQMPGATAPVPAGLMKLQAGAALKVMVLQMDLPLPIAAPLPSAAMPRPATNQPVAQGGTTPPPINAALPPLAPPMEGKIQPLAMAAPEVARIAQQGTGTSLPPTIAAPNQLPKTQPPVIAATEQKMPVVADSPAKGIPGLVIGHQSDGGNIVHTNLGTLKIYTPMPLPMHTKLTLEVKPDTAPPTQNLNPTLPLPEETDGMSSLSRGWPHLSEAMGLLNADPAVGRDAMQALPHVGPKLASGLLFFLAAVKGGDIRQWMGAKAFDKLELKMPDLASKLKGDMAQLQQLFLHSPLDQWTGVMLPMLHGEQLDYAKLYLRDEQSEGEKTPGKAKEQRFIIEMEFSHLGEMQFDGFVRQTAPKKQFDLIIRSARGLDPAITQDIRGMFETSIAATGYNGYLGFQQGSHHFVRPLAGAASGSERPSDSHTILA